MSREVKLKVTYDAPRTLFLRQKSNGRCDEFRNVIGETTRSWAAREYGRWYMRQKCEYDEITAKECREQNWALTHQYRIGGLVQCCNDPAILRQIASLIGYTEDAK